MKKEDMRRGNVRNEGIWKGEEGKGREMRIKKEGEIEEEDDKESRRKKKKNKESGRDTREETKVKRKTGRRTKRIGE